MTHSLSRLAPYACPMIGFHQVDKLLAKATDMEPAGLWNNDHSTRYSMGRRSDIKWLYRNREHDLWEEFDRIDRYFDAVADMYGFKVKPITYMQLARYRPGGWFNWHYDNAVPGDKRLLTVSIELKHATLGGGLEFDCYKEGIPQNFNVWSEGIGCGTFFPCYLKHKAKRVYLGERIAAVAWAEEA